MDVDPLSMLGLGLMGFAWMRTRKIGLLKAFDAAKPGSIRDSVDRYVVLTGFAEAMPGTSIRDPFLDQPCVWFSVLLRKENVVLGLADPLARYRSVSSKTSGKPFILRDESGACVLFPAAANVRVKFHEEKREGRDVPLMACIREGDRLFAVGNLQRRSSAAGGAEYELVGTREAPTWVTHFSPEELIRVDDRQSRSAIFFGVAGAVALVVSFFL